MKKHFIKSIISILTVFVMTAVFLPISEIKAAEDFNVYVYMADNILSEEKPANSIYWYYVKNPNRYKSMAEIWYESFSSDKDFMNSVATWETVNLALEPGDVYSKSIEAKGYYMTVLLSMLKCNSDTVINQLSSMSEVKAVSKNYQSFVKLFKELYSSYEEDDLNALLELHKDFYTPEEVDMLRNVQKEWFKQNYDESVLGGLSNAFDNYMTLYDSAQTVTELVNQFTSFCMVSQISDEWKDCIIYMYNNCGGCAVPLKAALEDMYNVVTSDNWNVAALSVVAKNAINTTGAEMFSTCVDFLIDEFIGNCPLVKGMDIGKAVGTSISNMLFATDKTIEQFYIISAYCKIFDLFLKSFQNVETRYLNNRTPENAKSFLRYVDMFYETFELGNSFGQDFTEVLYNGGIANVLFRSQEQYAAFTDYSKKCSDTIQQSHNTIQTLWLDDLYYDDLDMYAVYAEIFADKLNFISVTGVEFEKESVEWGLEDAVYLGYDCNVIPSNADCREILYSSSNENIAEIDSQGMLIVRSEGSCIITAAALENTDIKDTLLVTVVEGNGKDGLPYIEITPITPTPDEVDFEYTIDDGKVIVTKYIGDDADVIIPDTIEGCPIASIGSYAFWYCTSLESITIPDGVTSIGDDAFYKCTSLESITIPDSVTTIGYEAFYHCESLESITIPDSVTDVGNWAFAYCTSLASITIPDSVTSIGDYAFSGCTSLTNITIPDSVTSIGSYAFENCTSLESITIPNSVASIEQNTFWYCTSLESITIPDSVTSIGSWAFECCDSLTSITIPDSVTSIASSAFSYCPNLTIYGYSGSYAEKYAKNNDIPFVALDAQVLKPTITKAIAGDSKVALNWTAVDGAEKYAIYTYLNGKYTCIGGRAASVTGMYVTGLTNGTKYGFLVRAYINGAWSSFTAADIVYATPVGAAKSKITKAIAGDGKVALNWTAVNGAEKYAIYTYVNGKYTCVGSRASTVTGMYVTGLTNGTKYGFLVRAYINGAWSSFTTADIVYATPVGAAKPTITKAIAGNGKVALNWTAVNGAEKYAIYTYVNGKYTCVGSRASTVTGMYVTGLTNGTKYGFLVRAYINGAWSSFTTADIVYATPSASAAASDISFDETYYVAPVTI